VDRQIYMIAADGRSERMLAGGAEDPAWSPDGRRIAFTKYDYASGTVVENIYTIEVDGSRQSRLTSTAPNVGRDTDLAWSPDGRKIALVRTGVNGAGTAAPDVYVMNVDGSGQTRVAAAARDPAWSPDGGKVVFAGDCSSRVNDCSALYLVNPDGSGRTRLNGAAGLYLNPT
jgi:TolB protein